MYRERERDPDPETVSFRKHNTRVKLDVPRAASSRSDLRVWGLFGWCFVACALAPAPAAAASSLATVAAFAVLCFVSIPRDSEPPKRVVSGWVVSWDPSFALHIKKRVWIVACRDCHSASEGENSDIH